MLRHDLLHARTRGGRAWQCYTARDRQVILYAHYLSVCVHSPSSSCSRADWVGGGCRLRRQPGAGPPETAGWRMCYNLYAMAPHVHGALYGLACRHSSNGLTAHGFAFAREAPAWQQITASLTAPCLGRRPCGKEGAAPCTPSRPVTGVIRDDPTHRPHQPPCPHQCSRLCSLACRARPQAATYPPGPSVPPCTGASPATSTLQAHGLAQQPTTKLPHTPHHNAHYQVDRTPKPSSP